MKTTRLVEKNKRAGVHYAVTSEGVELPVVDVTHPAFALSVSEAEQRALVERFLREGQPLAGLPRPLRILLLPLLLRGSVLARCIQSAEGTFLSGMGTSSATSVTMSSLSRSDTGVLSGRDPGIP